jgi:hypothetical protein
MGDAPVGEVPFTLCDQIWEKLNAVMCSGSAIEENNEINEINIYPNPAQDFVIVDGIEKENFTVDIFDALGNRVIHLLNKRMIDISNLNSGVYIVSINCDQVHFRKSILVYD